MGKEVQKQSFNHNFLERIEKFTSQHSRAVVFELIFTGMHGPASALDALTSEVVLCEDTHLSEVFILIT